MRRTQLGILGGVAALMLVFTSFAVASVPTPTRIGTTSVGSAPRVFVDGRGTVNVLWTAATSNNFFTVRYARKPAGAKHFTTVALPFVFDPQNPFIYQLSPGVLRIIVENSTNSGVNAFNSTNDGVSWTLMDTTALNAAGHQAYSTYPNSSQLFDAPGGPIAFAGFTGNDIVQFNSSLTGLTTLATTTLSTYQIARTGAGATFILGVPSTGQAPYQVGAVTGQLSFPSCAATPSGKPDLAAGRSVAVVAEISCGHLRTRTITAGGAVGPLETIGSSPGRVGAENFGTDGVDLVADRSGNFTAAYVVAGGDVRVAHSSGGSSWKTAPGVVPVPDSPDGSNAEISTGAATWLASVTATGNTAFAVLANPLSNTYRPPSAPSGRGIAHPHHGSLGSLAVTVPGKLAVKSFRKNGKVTLKLVSALPDRIAGSVSVTRVAGGATQGVCSGSASTKLAAGRVRTVTYTCSSGAVVIGGTASSQIATKKGDLVTFSFTGRNGTLTLLSRVG